MADKYVNQLILASVPLLDSDITLITRDGIRVDRTPMSTVKSYMYTFPTLLASISNTSNTVPNSITDLSFPVVAGKTYFFEYVIRYQAAAATTGIAFTATTPLGVLTASLEAITTANGNAAKYVGSVLSSGQTVTTTTVPVAATDTMLNFYGVFVATAAGTFTPQFMSSINGSAVTIQLGSVGYLTHN
jgi:hypothetical protein